MKEECIPIIVFITSYGIFFFKSNTLRLKYTFYVYFESLCLVPLIPYYPYAHIICYINTFGLGIGITSFYVMTKYKVLKEFGKGYAMQFNWKKEPSIFFLLLIDFIYHWVPYILCTSYKNTYQNTKMVLFTGLMTGLCHSTYYKLATGIWDPRKGYGLLYLDVKSWQWCISWILVFIGHVMGAILYIEKLK